MQGHAGKLIVGTFVGRIVIAMKGRFHPYEGTLFRIGKFPGKLVQIKHLAILRIPGRDADRISGKLIQTYIQTWMSFPVMWSGSRPGKLKFRKNFWTSFPI